MTTPRPWLLPVLLAASAAPAPVRAQAPAAWNEPAALALVERARSVRAGVAVDSTLRSYRSQARGYVYFFADRPERDERLLLKADQVALELHWLAPGLATQRIVGLRDEAVLPTRIRYHLDHLTVVQDDFSDRIRLGDGDEVEAVLHPLGPAAEATYDYALGDSLTIGFPGAPEAVRVYEVRVRPKRPDTPGYVGSVYLDRESAAVVRMTFTFTPASYVDPSLDYIRISLDNSLWLGRFWLPYRQQAEVRREMPGLDMLAGSIIRSRFEIRDYELNADFPPIARFGPRVTAAPAAERESFPFERGLFDDLDEGGLASIEALDEVRRDAVQELGIRRLSGIRPIRLHLPAASDGVRYDRAEGWFVGGGLNLRAPGLELRPMVGYAFGRERPSLGIRAVAGAGPERVSVRAYWDELRDIGPTAGAAGAINTFAGLLTTRDFLDPYFARGVALDFTRRRARLGLRWEDHRSATDVVSAPGGEAFRPVLPVVPGRSLALDAELGAGRREGAGITTLSTLGRHPGVTFLRTLARVHYQRAGARTRPDFSLGASAGLASAETPPQALFLMGGRASVPGYPYRAWVGRGFWMVRAEGTIPVRAPWLGVRAFAAVGGAGLLGSASPPGWPSAAGSGGARPAVGVGLALGWNVLRLDLARGLRDGGWELILAVDPSLHGWL